MTNKNKILIGLAGVFVAGSVYAAQPGTIADILVQIGILQKKIDTLQSQNAPKLGNITAFSQCSLVTLGTLSRVNTANATTTGNTCDTGGRATNLAFLLQVGSNPTAGNFATFEYQFSVDNSTWYTELASLPPANGVAFYSHTASTTHRIVTTSTGTTTYAIPIDNVMARYVRVLFTGSQAAMNLSGWITQQGSQN